MTCRRGAYAFDCLAQDELALKITGTQGLSKRVKRLGTRDARPRLKAFRVSLNALIDFAEASAAKITLVPEFALDANLSKLAKQLRRLKSQDPAAFRRAKRALTRLLEKLAAAV